jgi:hypothetical protein
MVTGAAAILVARSFESLRGVESFDPRNHRLNERLRACGRTTKCDSFMGGLVSIQGNAQVVLIGCEMNPVEEMRFRAAWGHTDASEPLFAWSTTVREEEVFPLHGVLAEFIHCDDSKDRNGGRPGPLVELELEPPAFAGFAPAADHVFVPFDGEATFDHDGPTTVTLDAIADAADAPSVTIHVGRAGESAHIYDHLRAGNHFPWAERAATVVRIVESRPPLAGWVEVALPDPEESGIDRR